MRRFTLATAVAAVTLAVAPATALARHDSSNHHRGLARHSHHARSRHLAHQHARLRMFGDVGGQTTGGPSTTPSNPGAVGTVASFQNGVLTITLNDGSTVVGNVTGDTEIACASSTSGQASSGGSGPSSGEDQTDQSSGSGDQSSGSTDQSSGSGDQSSGSTDQSSETSDQSSGSTDQSSGDDDQTDGQSGQMSSCSTADMTTGRTVQAAELRISSDGKTWEKLILA